MRRRAALPSLVAPLALCATFALAAPAPDLGSDADRAAGKKLYEKNCAQCHGVKGDGQGDAAPFLMPRPRDFTAGKFKIRTTPSGALPTTQDLKHIIRAGMPYTAMPAWPQFSDPQLSALAYYVKSFSPDFAKPDRQADPIQIPSPPADSKESVERGKKIYADLGCANCHGELGRANGPTAPTLKDDWGHPIRAADLTRRWTFRGGPTRQDIFRAFSTGLNGTPMPSFVDLPVDQRWDLASYIASLSPAESPEYANLLVAKKVAGDINLADGAKAFEGAERAFFPIVGQIMQPGREFHPPCTGIYARAVYNDGEIAIELRWNDMQANTKGGKNAPDIAVPADEDKGEAPAAKPAAEAESGWGDAEVQEKPAAAPKADAADVWGEEAGGGDDAAAAGEFSDAVAIQFPSELPKSIRKPYFIFGDKSDAVDLWFADLARTEPVLYLGHGSDALQARGPRDLSVVHGYDKGEWTVAFKRKLRSSGQITFEENGFVPIAFSVWDGFYRERGNKRGLTNWHTIYLSPGEKPSATREMTKWALAALAVEFVFVAWARRRARGRQAS